MDRAGLRRSASPGARVESSSDNNVQSMRCTVIQVGNHIWERVAILTFIVTIVTLIVTLIVTPFSHWYYSLFFLG